MPVKDFAVMSIMVPKGLAAVVLASIPAQQGIDGGDIIKNITYGVVLFSIVLTSFLVLLMEKTPLVKLYGWMVSKSLPKLAWKGPTRREQPVDTADGLVDSTGRPIDDGEEEDEKVEQKEK